MRPEKIYISFSVVFCFIKSIRYFNCGALKGSNNKLRTILRELSNYYRLGCFQFINPKAVITFIDNSNGFHWLSENFSSAQFLAIQNGNRTNDQLEKTYQYHQHIDC